MEEAKVFDNCDLIREEIGRRGEKYICRKYGETPPPPHTAVHESQKLVEPRKLYF